MLRTIVATSSSEDSIVLDCFSGSGTTLVAADQLNRSWKHVRVDALQQITPLRVASFHSRANGRRHGITGAIERDGRVLVAAKGGNAILSLAVAP